MKGWAGLLSKAGGGGLGGRGPAPPPPPTPPTPSGAEVLEALKKNFGLNRLALIRAAGNEGGETRKAQ